MRYMRCWHITLKTLICTLHWFCEKSCEERHIEHLDMLGGRRWVHAVLSTQGFAKEDAAKHAPGHWCPWRSRPSVVVFFGLNMIEHIYGFVSFDKHSQCEAAPNRLQASSSIGPWIKHIKPVLILLRPDPRKPETLKPGYFWLHWNQLKVLAKGFRPAGEFCGHLPGPPGEVWYTANRYGLLSVKIASGGT